MKENNSIISYHDARQKLNLKTNPELDEKEFARLSTYITGLAALMSMMKENEFDLAKTLNHILGEMNNIRNHTKHIEELLVCSRVTDSDDLYVSLDEVSHLSGYGSKRCKQIMDDAIARGDIRIDQKEFINKAGKETQTRPRYHLGDCKRFWTPARVKKNRQQEGRRLTLV